MKLDNTLYKNIISNVVSKFWSVISVYIFVPFWIKILGVEGYGIIGFYTMMVSLLSFVDAGLSAAMTREFAKEISRESNYHASLLKTTELIYICISALIFIVIFLFSRQIASAFFNTKEYTLDELSLYVKLMGGILSVNLLFILYSGCLMGIRRQVMCNYLNIAYSLSRSAFVLIPLYYFPLVGTFFYWQLFSIIVVTLTSRSLIYSSIMNIHSSVVNFTLLKNIWRFSLGMMIMSIIGSINSQLDKLVISKLLCLKDLGMYMLASTVGQSVTLVIIPLSLAFYPELTRLISKDDVNDFKYYFILFSSLVSIISCTIGFTLCFYNMSYMYLWTSDMGIITSIEVSAKILVIANIFLSLQYAPYYLALSYGHTKTNIKIGLFSFILLIPSTFVLCQKWGMVGASIPFMLLNVLAFFVLSYFIVKHFLRDSFKEWCKICVIYPFVTCLLIVGGGYILYRGNLFSSIAILYSVIFVLISMYVAIYNVCKRYCNWIRQSNFRKILIIYPSLKNI